MIPWTTHAKTKHLLLDPLK